MGGTNCRERRAAEALVGALEQVLGELAGATGDGEIARHDRALATCRTVATRHALIRWAA
jgi:hypothetical protein